MATTQQQLRQAAGAVITSLQDVPDLYHAQVTIIGGVALQNHIQDRVTKVDLIPADLPPYLPANAATLGQVDPSQPNNLPFLPPLDLVVYKIHCCTMRPSRAKRTQDAKDTYDLINILSQQGPIALDQSQERAVLSGLDGMLEYSGQTREWWESVLGPSG